MSCLGNGECFQQCDYDCYEKRLECAYNCELRPCNNFIICQKKYPQWYLNCHNGCDTHCDMQYGPLKFLDEETSIWEDLQVIWKCPKMLFVKALFGRILK